MNHAIVKIESDGVLDFEKVERIAANASAITESLMQLSYIAAISGAMRWPYSFRPEVSVIAKTYLN